MGIKVVVRKARGYPVEGYPVEVVAMDDGKEISQVTHVRDRTQGLIFGNGMITAYMSVDRKTGMKFEDHNVVFEDDL